MELIAYQKRIDSMGPAGLSLRSLDSDELVLRLKSLVSQERECTADVIEHLMEVERRELALENGFPSLFAYCLKVLGYSEAGTYVRIRAARAAAQYPRILDDLRTGRLHLEAVARLYPHLKQDNYDQLLGIAAGATTREVKALVATLGSEPPAERDVIIPMAPKAIEANSVTPIEPEVIPEPRHRFHFSADQQLLDLVERLRGLLRHKYPSGRIEDIFKEAARNLIAVIEPGRKTGKRGRKPSGKRTRLVPKAVKDEVWARDGGKCSYFSPAGKRCESQNALEYDHIVAWADGGRSDCAENIRLLCRAHNLHLGRKRFGDRRRSGPGRRAGI